MKQLNLTDLEAQVVVEALRTYQHMHIGNFENAADCVLMHTDADLDAIHKAREAFKDAQECITGYRNGGPSITNPAVHNFARVARNIEAKVKGEDLKLYTKDGDVRA